MTRTYAAVALATAVAMLASSASADDKKKKQTKGAPAAAGASVTVAAPTATVKVEEPTAKVTVAEPTAHATVTEPAASGTVEVVERGGEGADRAGFSVAGLVGFVAANAGSSAFAIGARAGYTFPFHLYLGGDATFYVGSNTIISIAPEVGYDIGIGRAMVVRPYIGLGFADATAGGLSAFEFYPGGEFLYSLTPGLFVGGDVRIPLILLGGGLGTVAGFNLMGTIGYKF